MIDGVFSAIDAQSKFAVSSLSDELALWEHQTGKNAIENVELSISN
jgi:hypothetical protein